MAFWLKRKKSSDSISAPLPQEKARSQVIGLNDKNESILARVERADIKLDYVRLLKQLENPAIKNKDFQYEFPWQLVLFTVQDPEEIAKFLSSEYHNKKFPDKQYFRLSNYLAAAALGGNIPAMEYALNLIPTEKRDAALQEALYYTARSGSVDAMKSALEKGAKALIDKGNPARESETGATLLHCAAESGQLEAMKFAHELIKTLDGDNDNNTVLHYAVRANNPATAEYCVEKLKISPNLPNKTGHTATDLAEQYPDVSKIFKRMSKIITLLEQPKFATNGLAHHPSPRNPVALTA